IRTRRTRPSTHVDYERHTEKFGTRWNASLPNVWNVSRDRSFSLPPEHEFEAGAVGIGARHPALPQIEVGCEAFHQLRLRDTERRTVVVANHVIDREILPVWL